MVEAPPQEYRTAWEDLEAASEPHCVDVSGRVALVTGANDPGAIGYHMALYLARCGAKVYVGARSRPTALQAIARMREMQADTDLLLEPFVADLRDLQQVKTASDRLKAVEARLDIVINNAAISEDPAIKTEYGLATTMVVNYLAPFLLVNNLQTLLVNTARAGGDVRVVNMTSTVHTVIDGLNLDCTYSLNVDPQWKSPRTPTMQQYALSKLALVMHAKTLQRHCDAQGIPILAMSVFPGFAKTTRTLKLMGESPDMVFTASDCAFTGLFAATEPSVRTSGKRPSATNMAGRSSESGETDGTLCATDTAEGGTSMAEPTSTIEHGTGAQEGGPDQGGAGGGTDSDRCPGWTTLITAGATDSGTPGSSKTSGTSKPSGSYGGAYIVPFGVIGRSTATAEDETLGERLWELSSRIVEDVLWML
ncbi:NAD(P)-binding protein [Schizophyllum commune Tattone D]|nr:NAD(P)-binding protein [Schizophyllum commune Tattone D]